MSADVQLIARGIRGAFSGAFAIHHKELRGSRIVLSGREDGGDRTLELSIEAEVLDLVEPPAAPDRIRRTLQDCEDRVLARNQL